MPDVVLSRHNVGLPNTADQLLPSTPTVNYTTGPIGGTGATEYANLLGDFNKKYDATNGQLNVPFGSPLKAALRYEDPEIGYHPFDNDLEYKYADAHPWQTAGNNLLQFGARFGGAFLESIATIPIAIGALMERDSSKLYDNDVTNGISNWLEDLNRSLPTYRTEYEEEHPIMKFLNPLKFTSWMGAIGGAVNNLGYTAGAIAGALATDALLGVATGGIGLGPALAAQGAKLSKGIQALTKTVAKGDDIARLGASSVDDVALRGQKLLGEGAEMGVMRAEGTGQFQAGGQHVDDLLGIGRHARDAAVNKTHGWKKLADGTRYQLGLLTSAAAEGAFEAVEVYHRGVDELKMEFYERYGRDPVGDELAQIDRTAKEASNTTMGANIALLYVSNRVNWGGLFASTEQKMLQGGITGWGKGIGRTKVTGKLDDVVDDAKNVIDKKFTYATETITPTSRIGKIMLNAEKAGKIASRSVNEGLEEAAQFTIGEGTLQYAKDKYDPYVMNETASLLKGLKDGADKTFTTNEGWDNIMGGFVGGILGGAAMGRIQRKAPLTEQMARQVQLMNSATFNGVLAERFKDATAQTAIGKRHAQAVREKDIFAAKNTHFDMLFNWVNSGIKANAYERRILELDLLRDLKGDDFQTKWGMEDNEVNRGKANSFLDGMKTKAEMIKKDVEKVRYITKNPFKPSDIDNYTAYESYKDELSHNLSTFREYQERINGMTGDLKKHYPLMDVKKAVNLTSVEGLSRILKDLNKSTQTIAGQLRDAQEDPTLTETLTRKKEAIDSIYDRVSKIVQSGKIQTSKNTKGETTLTGRTDNVDFNGDDLLSALNDLYDLHNGTSFESSRYVQRYADSVDNNIIDITDQQQNIDDDVKADLLEKLQDIYKLSDANYNIGKYYTYLRKGVGFTEFDKKIRQIRDEARAKAFKMQDENYAKEREEAIRAEEVAAIVPEEGDEEMTPEEEKVVRSAAKKAAKKQPLTKEEEDIVEAKPKVFTKHKAAETRTAERMKEEKLEVTEQEPESPDGEVASENPQAGKSPIKPNGTVEPFSGITPHNLFGMFSQDRGSSKLRTSLHKAIFGSATEETMAGKLGAAYSIPETVNPAIIPIPGTKLFRKGFEENVTIYSGTDAIGILRPPVSVFLDAAGTRSIYDMTAAEYSEMTGNQSDTYDAFMKHIKDYRESYNKLRDEVINGDEVDVNTILKYFKISVNPGSRKTNTNPKLDVKLNALTRLPTGTALLSLDADNKVTVVNSKELGARKTAEVLKFAKDNAALIQNTYRYMVVIPILGKYDKRAGIVGRNAETTEAERNELLAGIKQVASAQLSEDEANATLGALADKFYISASRENAGLFIDFRFDEDFQPSIRLFDRSKNLVEELPLEKAALQSATSIEDLTVLINTAIRTAKGRQTSNTALSKLDIEITPENIKRQIPDNKEVEKLADLGDVMKLATDTADIFVNFNLEFTGDESAKPEVKPSFTAAAAADPAEPVSTTQFAKDEASLTKILKKVFNMTPAQAKATAQIYMLKAQAWAARTGKTVDDWFKTFGFDTKLPDQIGEEFVFSKSDLAKMAEEVEVLNKTLTYPGGTESNLTEVNWFIVRTPTFKKWFGDWENDPANSSKVVDERGEPLLQYHWGPKGIEVFNLNGVGSHFGTYKAATELNEFRDGLNTMTETDLDTGEEFTVTGTKEDGKFYGVFLNIRNPLRVNDTGSHSMSDFGLELVRELKNASEEDIARLKGLENGDSLSDLNAIVNKYGYDGYIYTNTEEDRGSDSYIAITAESIKSEHSKGFSSANPNIFYQESSNTDKVVKGFELVEKRDNSLKVGYTSKNGLTGKALLEAVERWIKDAGLPVRARLNLTYGTIQLADSLLFQDARGAFDTSSRVIYGLTDPRIDTPIHEMAHAWEEVLTADERKVILDWAGHKEWTRETSEKFADGFTVYMSEGNKTNKPELTSLFNKFAKWLADIYTDVAAALGITLNDGMRTIYSNMLNSEFVAPVEKVKVVKAVKKATVAKMDPVVTQSLEEIEIAQAEAELQAAIDAVDPTEDDYSDIIAVYNSVHKDVIKDIKAKYNPTVEAIEEEENPAPIEEEVVEETQTEEVVTEEATTEPAAPTVVEEAPKKRSRKRVSVNQPQKVDIVAEGEAFVEPIEAEEEIVEPTEPVLKVQYVSFPNPDGTTGYGAVSGVEGNLMTIITPDGREIFRAISKVNNVTEATYTEAVGKADSFTFKGVKYEPKFGQGNTVVDNEGKTHVIESVELVPDLDDITQVITVVGENGAENKKATISTTKGTGTATMVYTTTDGIKLIEPAIAKRLYVSGQDQKQLKDKYNKNIKHIESLLQRLSQFFGGIRYEYVEMDFAQPARFYKGIVQINLNRIEEISRNADEILIHEFIHPFVKALQMSNRRLYDNLVKDLETNFPNVIEEARGYYKETDYVATDLIDEALTLHLGRNIATAFRQINSINPVSLLYDDIKPQPAVNGKVAFKYKGEVIGELREGFTVAERQALADKVATELSKGPLEKERLNLYTKFRNWFNTVMRAIKKKQFLPNLSKFITKANKAQSQFRFVQRTNTNGTIELERGDESYITVNIDPEFVKDAYDIQSIMMLVNKQIGDTIAGTGNYDFTAEDSEALEAVFFDNFFGAAQNPGKNTFTTSRLHGDMSLRELSFFLAEQLAENNLISNIEFENSEIDAFDEIEAYFKLTDPQLEAMRKRVVSKFGLLEDTAKSRLGSEDLKIQTNAARKLDLDNKDDLDFMLGYMENAAVSINLAYVKYGKLMEKLKNAKGTSTRQELNALNKDFAVIRQMVSYYDQFTSYAEFKDFYKGGVSERAGTRDMGYYASAFNNQQKLREAMQDTATNLTVEWLTPYAEMHTKLMKEQGYTDEKYEVTPEKLYKLFKYGNGRDTNYITFFLGSNVTSRDPINAIFANTLGDMLSMNNIIISQKSDDFAVAFDQFLKSKGISVNSSKAQQDYFKKHYLRKAKMRHFETDPVTKVETETIIEKWAFHQEYKFDEYELDLLEEAKKYKNPRSSAEADLFNQQFTAWKKLNNDGKIAKYANPEYAAAKADPFFQALETSYNDSNQRYGTNQLRFGIIPQQFEISYAEKLKRGAELFKGKDKLNNVKDALTDKFAAVTKEDSVYNLDGSVYRHINTTLSSIKEERNISLQLDELMPSFIVESNNYSTLKETQYGAETLLLLLEGNAKLSITPRTFAQEDFNAKIREPIEFRKLQERVKEMELLRDSKDPAFDPVLYKTLKDKEALGIQSYNIWDKLANRMAPSKTDYNNQMLASMIKDRYFGEAIETPKVGKIDAVKAAHYLRLFTSVNNMAGNYVAGLGNISIGNLQLFIEAHGGKYFNKKDLANAAADYTKNIPNYIADLQRPIKSKDTQLSIMLDAIQGEIENEFGVKVSGNIARQMFRTSTLFLFTKAGEHQLQLTNMKAMLNARKVTTNAGETISLYEAFTTDTSGRVSLRKDLKDFNNDSLAKFMRDMHGVNRMLNGNYSDLHKTMLQRKWYGNLLLSYRKYIYPSVRARYASEHVDFERSTVEVGYFRYFMFDYLPKGIKNIITGKGGFEKFKTLKPHQQYALRKTAAELGAYGALTALAVGVFGSGDDEAKKKLTPGQKFGLLMLLRLRSDIGVWHLDMPSELIRQFKSPTASLTTVVAVANVLKQLTTNPFEKYEQDYGVHQEGDSKLEAKVKKLVPLVSKFQSSLDDKLGYMSLLGRNAGDFIEGVIPKNDSR